MQGFRFCFLKFLNRIKNMHCKDKFTANLSYTKKPFVLRTEVFFELSAPVYSQGRLRLRADLVLFNLRMQERMRASFRRQVRGMRELVGLIAVACIVKNFTESGFRLPITFKNIKYQS